MTHWGCDYLACSAYKFFGPHVGILWGRKTLMAELTPYKVRPAADSLPDRWDCGTQNHEGIAGTLAAVEYLADLGERFGDADGAGAGAAGAGAPGVAGAGRRARILAGMRAIEAYEREVSARVLAGLAGIPGLTVHGLADPGRADERTPTFAVTLAGWTPRGVAEALAARGIYAWDGDFYATTLVEDLGLAASGGVVRLGMVHYTTFDEVDRLIGTLQELASHPGS